MYSGVGSLKLYPSLILFSSVCHEVDFTISTMSAFVYIPYVAVESDCGEEKQWLIQAGLEDVAEQLQGILAVALIYEIHHLFM